ncbi:MAG: hypothetical protein IT441_06850 [Phycisphaeraceae bacterium]|nr:hypothetical protein [Phycisphaeraceae bacterium]
MHTMRTDLHALARSTRYPLEAFLFVQKGLDHTVRKLHGELNADNDTDDAPEPKSRHITGPQLCLGLRDHALEEYGLLAKTVLRSWHITRSEDFGNIVFAMVDAGFMQKTDEDSIEDFIDVMDFNQAFEAELELTEN